MKKLTRYILIYVFMLLCVFSAFVGVYGVKNANALEAIPMATLSLKGSGRYRDPYLISNAKEYNNFSDYVNAGNTMSGKYIQLNADINFSSTKLKTINKTFSGNLNGKYHTMSNVTATLFNSISSARISYINIEKARIMVYGEDVDYVGIISNTSNSSTIQYIHILSGSCSDGIVSRGANSLVVIHFELNSIIPPNGFLEHILTFCAFYDFINMRPISVLMHFFYSTFCKNSTARGFLVWLNTSSGVPSSIMTPSSMNMTLSATSRAKPIS